MIVTLYMVDGRKVTADAENILIALHAGGDIYDTPTIKPGNITVNWANVCYMREAYEEEKECYKLHGC